MTPSTCHELPPSRPAPPLHGRYVALITQLRNPGMRERHWEAINAKTGLQVNFSENSLSLSLMISNGSYCAMKLRSFSILFSTSSGLLLCCALF